MIDSSSDVIDWTLDPISLRVDSILVIYFLGVCQRAINKFAHVLQPAQLDFWFQIFVTRRKSILCAFLTGLNLIFCVVSFF